KRCLPKKRMEWKPQSILTELNETTQPKKITTTKGKTAKLYPIFESQNMYLLGGLHIELHSMTIEERYKSFCQRSSHLLQLVPHKYIASYLGIDPTNFSKLFNTLKF